jgi:hypothetical protein
MIKLKKILKESSPGFENRKFGDALPTLDSVKASYDSKNGTIQEDNLNEAPMDKRFAKEWERNCKILITHLEHEQKGKLGAHKGTVKKMIDMLRTVKEYPKLMGSLFGEE